MQLKIDQIINSCGAYSNQRVGVSAGFGALLGISAGS